MGTIPYSSNIHQFLFLYQLKFYFSRLRYLSCDFLHYSQFQAFHNSTSFTGQNIYFQASINGNHAGKCLIFFPIRTKLRMNTSFFNIDNRILSIRRKGHGSFLFHCIVMRNITTAALFISTYDQASIFSQFDS